MDWAGLDGESLTRGGPRPPAPPDQAPLSPSGACSSRDIHGAESVEGGNPPSSVHTVRGVIPRVRALGRPRVGGRRPGDSPTAQGGIPQRPKEWTRCSRTTPGLGLLKDVKNTVHSSGSQAFTGVARRPAPVCGVPFPSGLGRRESGTSAGPTARVHGWCIGMRGRATEGTPCTLRGRASHGRRHRQRSR
jgi:hypothetical protein